MTDDPDRVRRRLAALDKFMRENGNFGVWDTIVSIGSPDPTKLVGLHGEFNDWPAYVQDAIWKSFALQCGDDVKKGYNVRVVASGCYQDVPYEPCYIRVVIQEYPAMVKN